MPLINYPCDKCNSKLNSVYEHYQLTGKGVYNLRREPMTGRMISDNLSYLCKECLNSENEKNE